MSSFLSMNTLGRSIAGCLLVLLAACGPLPWNNPYPKQDSGRAILYQAFSERPKHLDPAVAYSANEYEFIAQVYEPPLQYHYLKRPYELVPLTAERMPEVRYLDIQGQPLTAPHVKRPYELVPLTAEHMPEVRYLDVQSQPPAPKDEDIAFTEYVIRLRPGIQYQPHPALAKAADGNYLYHRLAAGQTAAFTALGDFKVLGSRELTAEDYVYQIKRLAHPKNQSPIAGILQNYLVGFAEFAREVKDQPTTAIKNVPMAGVQATGRYQYRIRIRGKYPQFMFWLAMPFFAPMPWEAEVFYGQPGLAEKNITLDWYPIGTGAYFLAENNPNRRMVLAKNPYFHGEAYPAEGEPGDEAEGLLQDAGKPMPFIERVVFTLEKETIPYWTKFLQGYYDASGVASDNFDQAIQFSGGGAMELTPALYEKNIDLQAAVSLSNFYLGFNMLDPTVGGTSERARKLRQAIAIAIDYEEFISIFTNGRGVAAQGVLPPGIYGHVEGEAGINRQVYTWQNGRPQRRPVSDAEQLLIEAGYAHGIDPSTRRPLVLYFDTAASGIDDRPRMNWYRKQLEKLGIELVIRATDYNRFQEKMRTGNAQLFVWGWNADYPDPENFFFLLYGGHAKAKTGGENAANYANPQFDRLFEQMRSMDNSAARYQIIQEMQAIVRHDAPWVLGFHPKNVALFHAWYQNVKLNLMANNTVKYARIDPHLRERQRLLWNRPVLWPLLAGVGLVVVLLVLAARRARRSRLDLE